MANAAGGGTTKVVIALDSGDLEEAKRTVDALADRADLFKIGSILFTAAGPRAVEAVRLRDKQVFLDLKFHDIPNTVMGAVAGAAAMGVAMLTVHCAGGQEMLRAALKGAEAGASKGAGAKRPKVIGVTVLTSLAGKPDTPKRVLDYAGEAAASGIDGVVCSPLEVGEIKRAHGRKLVTVVPGIRLSDQARDDQARVGTPGQAARDGADFIVLGRSVTGAGDPRAVLERIIGEIEAEGRRGC
jgi:orotidine-5'-phosphate decarboxylase